MTVAIRVEGLERVQRKLRTLLGINFGELLDVVGSEIESQTDERFETKVDPDGKLWGEWSRTYAASEHGDTGHKPHPGALRSSQGHTILQLSDDLRSSIQSVRSGNTLEVGSNMEYAGAMQATRAFLGISDDNKDDLEDLIADFLARRLARA